MSSLLDFLIALIPVTPAMFLMVVAILLRFGVRVRLTNFQIILLGVLPGIMVFVIGMIKAHYAEVEKSQCPTITAEVAALGDCGDIEERCPSDPGSPRIDR